MSIAHHIGFDIGRNAFRMVELRATDGFPVVLRTGIAETPRDFVVNGTARLEPGLVHGAEIFGLHLGNGGLVAGAGKRHAVGVTLAEQHRAGHAIGCGFWAVLFLSDGGQNGS